MQEVRNAVDQAQRELATRFDFKGTNAAVEQADAVLTLTAPTEDRLAAVRQVLEEKLVRRDVSLKALDYGKVEEASGGTARQRANIVAGISSEKAREVNKAMKELGLKGVQSQTQGEQVRVTGQEARRPAGGHQGPEGAGPRDPAPVHELPGLAREAPCLQALDHLAQHRVGQRAEDAGGPVDRLRPARGRAPAARRPGGPSRSARRRRRRRRRRARRAPPVGLAALAHSSSPCEGLLAVGGRLGAARPGGAVPAAGAADGAAAPSWARSSGTRAAPSATQRVDDGLGGAAAPPCG